MFTLSDSMVHFLCLHYHCIEQETYAWSSQISTIVLALLISLRYSRRELISLNSKIFLTNEVEKYVFHCNRFKYIRFVRPIQRLSYCPPAFLPYEKRSNPWKVLFCLYHHDCCVCCACCIFIRIVSVLWKIDWIENKDLLLLSVWRNA